MKIALARFFVLLMVLGSSYFSFNDYTYPGAVNIYMLCWTGILLLLGIWTLKSPRWAFLLILAFYLITISYRYIRQDGEFPIFIIVHVVFIASVIAGIVGSFTKKE